MNNIREYQLPATQYPGLSLWVKQFIFANDNERISFETTSI